MVVDSWEYLNIWAHEPECWKLFGETGTLDRCNEQPREVLQREETWRRYRGRTGGKPGHQLDYSEGCFITLWSWLPCCLGSGMDLCTNISRSFFCFGIVGFPLLVQLTFQRQRLCYLIFWDLFSPCQVILNPKPSAWYTIMLNNNWLG